MEAAALPNGLEPLADVAERVIRHVYEANSERYDEQLGDDFVTFGISVYRHSWYRLDREFDEHPDWHTSRPEGSLLIVGAGYRIHVYRFGQDEHVELERFRLEDAASNTKRFIAEANALQLSFALDTSEPKSVEDVNLRELVLLHAGNPEDGCCGIWIGAPIPTEKITSSPWAWIKPVWLVERSEAPTRSDRTSRPVRHDELPEPEIQVTAIGDDMPSAEGG